MTDLEISDDLEMLRRRLNDRMNDYLRKKKESYDDTVRAHCVYSSRHAGEARGGDAQAAADEAAGIVMDEREQARRIAEWWLSFEMNAITQMVPGDPDCDACVLARQYLRALDLIDVLRSVGKLPLKRKQAQRKKGPS